MNSQEIPASNTGVPVFDAGDLDVHAHTRSSSRSWMVFSSQESRIALVTFFALLLALLLSGCSTSSSGPGGIDGDSAYAGLSAAELDAELARRYGEGSIPTAEGDGVFKDVRFGFDSANISDTARQQISYNAEVLKVNPGLMVTLEGHCDERGTSDYNLALGQRRAQSVQEVLSSLGISRDRMEIISYGSEVPLDPASTEEAWAKNRRVHFTPFRKQQ